VLTLTWWSSRDTGTSRSVQWHLMGAPPARVAMRAGDGQFTRTVSADEVDEIGEFVEQALLVESHA